MIEPRGPKTVAIFMDGNRRWAREHAFSLATGYTAGKDVFARFLDFYTEVREKWGTMNYIFYAFSTENWQRPSAEVAIIMHTFEQAFDVFTRMLPKLQAEGVRIRFLGEREKLSQKLQSRMTFFEEETKNNARGTIALAMPYGGRADILQAVSALLKEGHVTIKEEDIAERLWTRGIADPDLVIRPGGEARLSNFLTWQSTYSELAFSDTLWPDFSRTELEQIFAEYATRNRRRGK